MVLKIQWQTAVHLHWSAHPSSAAGLRPPTCAGGPQKKQKYGKIPTAALPATAAISETRQPGFSVCFQAIKMSGLSWTWRVSTTAAAPLLAVGELWVVILSYFLQNGDFSKAQQAKCGHPITKKTQTLALAAQGLVLFVYYQAGKKQDCKHILFPNGWPLRLVTLPI